MIFHLNVEENKDRKVFLKEIAIELVNPFRKYRLYNSNLPKPLKTKILICLGEKPEEESEEG